jgi:hypothetical protein
VQQFPGSTVSIWYLVKDASAQFAWMDVSAAYSELDAAVNRSAASHRAMPIQPMGAWTSAGMPSLISGKRCRPFSR